MKLFSLDGLRPVLVSQVVLPVLLLLILVLTASLSLVGKFVEKRMQEDLRLVARTIYLPVSQAVQRHDLAQLQNSMASVFGQAEVYGAYLFDAKGRRISSFGAVNPTHDQATRALKRVDNGEFARYERIRGQQVYSFFMPIFNEAGQPNGFLQVTRRRSDIDNQLASLQRITWGGFILVSILILAVLTLTHQRAIGRPIRRLLNSIEKVSAGDQQHRAIPQGPYELKQLAIGLNDMLDAIELAEQREQLQRYAREKMAERLQHSETMAALGQISAGLAHELAAPLTVVDGRANRLLRRCDDSDTSHELTAIRQQVQRMTSIIEQLLSFGRTSRSKKQLLSISTLIDRAKSLLTQEGKHITVVHNSDVMTYADPLGLEQAFVNLMRNACQACPDGEVRVSWQQDQHLITVMIDDSGPGIADNKREEIFEPFVTSKKPGEGSGLGLAIVKRILHEHNAEIAISDSPLGGARFLLTFKRQTEENNA